jgi:hypothetical protein
MEESALSIGHSSHFAVIKQYLFAFFGTYLI